MITRGQLLLNPLRPKGLRGNKIPKSNCSGKPKFKIVIFTHLPIIKLRRHHFLKEKNHQEKKMISFVFFMTLILTTQGGK